MQKIKISVENLTVEAELNHSNTADKIFEALPIKGTVYTWGDEIYFNLPVDVPLESDAVADVDIGDLAYWPTGPAFCIFFGPTPLSTDEKPLAYSPVNVFGKVIGDASVFKMITDGAKIVVQKV